MQMPASLLRLACVALTLAAYYLMLFTDWGNQYRVVRPARAVILDVTVVLAAFACWEVFRTERVTPVRAVAAAVGVPLALFALLTLWYGLRRYLEG